MGALDVDKIHLIRISTTFYGSLLCWPSTSCLLITLCGTFLLYLDNFSGKYFVLMRETISDIQNHVTPWQWHLSGSVSTVVWQGHNRMLLRWKYLSTFERSLDVDTCITHHLMTFLQFFGFLSSLLRGGQRWFTSGLRLEASSKIACDNRPECKRFLCLLYPKSCICAAWYAEIERLNNYCSFETL